MSDAAGAERATVSSATAPPRLSWTVADNYDVKAPFSSLPRYRLYYSYTHGVATTTLAYRGRTFAARPTLC